MQTHTVRLSPEQDLESNVTLKLSDEVYKGELVRVSSGDVGCPVSRAGPVPYSPLQPRQATSVPQRATGTSQPRLWRRSRHNRLGKFY